MSKLEDVHKEAVKKFGEEPLTGAAEQRYRRVLGQLAWTALSRADLSFPISFLSRFQAKPNPAAEHCRNGWLCIFILCSECRHLSAGKAVACSGLDLCRL